MILMEGAQLGMVLVPTVVWEERWREIRPGFLPHGLSPGVSRHNCRVNNRGPELGMKQGTGTSKVISSTRLYKKTTFLLLKQNT